MKMSFSFTYNSCVRGHHVYKAIWTPKLNEELLCRREPGNKEDLHAVATMKDDVVVGHVPRKISTLCSSFIKRGGSIVCKVTGERRYSYDLKQGGLEVPCTLTFTSTNDGEIKKVEKLLADQIPAVVLTSSNEVAKANIVCPDDEPAAKNPRLDSDEDDEVWLRCCPAHNLKFADKDLITQNKQLNDAHMTYGQHLLKLQFPHINGFSSTQTIHRQAPYCHTDHVIQIFFTRSCHWIVASNTFSGDGDVSKDTHDLISHLFKGSNISVVQPQEKQSGTKDCGLYALAFATSLAYGHNPSTVTYNQAMMRKHIIDCFENKKIVPF